MTEPTNSKVPKIRFKGFEGEWEKKTFDQNITSIQTGTNLLGSASGKGTPLLKMGNIQRGYFSLERLEFLDDRAKVEAENITHFGDFLFNTRNTLDLVGKGATWMGVSGKFAFNSNLARFKFRGIDTVFFNYLYNTQSLVSQVKARAMGTTSVAAVYPQSLNSLEYKLPSPAEQTQIGGYFREVDRLIGLQQGKHDKLVTLKKAMLHAMFPQPGATTPAIRFQAFSGPWVEKKLVEVGDTQSGIGFPDAEQGGKTGTPFFKVSDMNRTGNEQEMFTSNNYVSDEQLIRKKWTPISNVPAVIFAKVGAAVMLNRKRLVTVPFLIDNNMMAYLFDASWDTSFGRILFETINLPFYAQVGALPSYNGSDIESIAIQRPDKAEQQKIGSYFRTLDELISRHALQLHKLKQLKSACLERMFV